MDRSHTLTIRVPKAVRAPACVAVLAAVFLLALSGVAFADVWTDISDATWQSVYHVSAADASTVAEGYPDGTFRPSLAITRGQFAKMAASGLEIPLKDPLVPTFSDVPASNIFYPYIEGAVDAGVMFGFPDGTFRPNNNITRQQSNSILGRWLSQQEIGEIGGIQGADGFYATLPAWFANEGDDVLSGFADRAQVAPVHRPGTAYLAMRGVVLGSSSGGTTLLNPLGELKRVQAVAMILRTRDTVFEAVLPTVTHVEPATGPPAGGTSVVITGTGFGGLSGAAAVRFGTHNATSYVVNSVTQITAVAPAGTAGTTVNISVTTPAGTSAVSAAGEYSYLVLPTVTLLAPAAGVAAGGNSVVITGTGFTDVTAVRFGTVNATSHVVDSATQITAVAPAGTAGTTVDVTITTLAGTSSTLGAGNDYTYGAPTVTALDPTGGTTAGGTAATITGTNFVAGATVAFGTGNPATVVAVVNATTITCLSPAHAAGVVDVAVTTPAGTSSTADAGNDYTYILDTADVALALTTPAPGGGNSIAGGGAVRTVAVGVVNTTASVVLTGTKLAGQAVVIGGANAADVVAAGTDTAPIYTVNTSSVSAAGGSKVFTLTVSETGTADIVYTVTVTVAAPDTADIALALTTPAPGGGNSITGGGAVRTVAVGVVNGTASVVLTGTKLAAQTVAIGGADAANVTAGGSATAPTYTITTSSVSAAGGSKVFTLTVSETGRADIVYTVTVTVAIPDTADVALALTTPAPGGGNSITGGGAVRTVAVGVVNGTASVVLTGTKLAGQAVVIGGADAVDVTVSGTGTAPIYTVNTSSISAAGGSKVFTLTISETGKADIVYTVTVTVAGV